MGRDPMWEMVLGLADQLAWEPEVEGDLGKSELVLLAGMGGSAMAAEHAGLAVTGPGMVLRGYGLPAWARAARPLLVAVSFSGDTEETLSAAEEAEEAGLEVCAVTSGGELERLSKERDLPIVKVPGGLQPRAALGYMVVGALRLLEAAGLVADAERACQEAATVLRGLIDEGAPDLAEDLAEGLVGTVPVVVGSDGPAAVAARRWKTQLNENAEVPAFWSVLPEADHNEIEGWGELPGRLRGLFRLVFLHDRDEDPRLERRFRLTNEMLGQGVSLLGEVWAEGEGTLARALSLTLVGDLVSVSLAERSGVEAVPVTRLEEFKRRLREG